MTDSERLDWLQNLRGVDICVARDQQMMGEDFLDVPTWDFCIVEEDRGALMGHGKTLRDAIDDAAQKLLDSD